MMETNVLKLILAKVETVLELALVYVVMESSKLLLENNVMMVLAMANLVLVVTQHARLQLLVQSGYQGFVFTGIRTGIDNVLEEYPGSIRDKGLRFRDMHPFHCFRFDFNLNYNINRCLK